MIQYNILEIVEKRNNDCIMTEICNLSINLKHKVNVHSEGPIYSGRCSLLHEVEVCSHKGWQ